MDITRLKFASGFRVVLDNGRAQAAEMALDAGEITGGPDNTHPDADQWLFVVSGRGEAVVEGRSYSLEPGSLLLIERDEAHEIRAASDGPLETVNVYVPPVY